MTQTLKQALKHARDTRWRTNDSAYAQARIAVDFLLADMLDRQRMTICGPEIRPETVQRVTAEWYRGGLSPATINKRLSCLSVLGVTIPGYEKDPPKLKWWLRPEEEERAGQWLKATSEATPRHDFMARDRIIELWRVIRWTTRTGFRIEETLRLARHDFGSGFQTVTVPGLKTATSQAELPLSDEAAAIAAESCNWDSPEVFPITYAALEGEWRKLRTAMGWEGNGVTLKALRRSAARYLHVTCGMPLDMVRHYLRHEDIETTMGYLRLTGGYGTDEMRRYLK